jgi:hypothetical protein
LQRQGFMKRIITVIIVFAFGLVYVSAYACMNCEYEWVIARVFNDADAVFIGTVLEGELVAEDHERDLMENVREEFKHAYPDGTEEQLQKLLAENKKFQNDLNRLRRDDRLAGNVRFSVDEAFKGDLNGEVVVNLGMPHYSWVGYFSEYTRFSCGDMSLSVLPNERVIVFAEKNDDADRFYTNSCTLGVFPLNDKEKIDFLRKLPPAGSGGTLQGKVFSGEKPLANFNLVIHGNDNGLIPVTTNRNGFFEAKPVKPGVYWIEPEATKNASYSVTREQFEKVTVTDRGTGWMEDFEFIQHGIVKGRVANPQSADLGGISLYLDHVSLSNDPNDHQDKNIGDFVKEHNFEFSFLPEGEYLLSFEPSKGKHRNKRYYYPGTFEESAAEKIKVRMNEKVDGIEFLIPEDFEAAE